MARLIEVQDLGACRSVQKLKVGDMLLCHAAGGRIRSGKRVVEMLGPLVQAIVGNEGEIVTPMGSPNTVLLRSLAPGRAVIGLVTGDPFHSPEEAVLRITVEA